jgi:hypothetical protein
MQIALQADKIVVDHPAYSPDNDSFEVLDAAEVLPQCDGCMGVFQAKPPWLIREKK